MLLMALESFGVANFDELNYASPKSFTIQTVLSWDTLKQPTILILLEAVEPSVTRPAYFLHQINDHMPSLHLIQSAAKKSMSHMVQFVQQKNFGRR